MTSGNIVRSARLGVAAALLTCVAIVPAWASASTAPDALFITKYAFGETKMEQRHVSDLTEMAFSVDGPPWRIERALTLTASVPVFERFVDDISPNLRGRIFFAIDNDGKLNIYKDTLQSTSVIQTFGHIDVVKIRQAMPSRMWQEMHDGVRIDTIEEYRSVLSTLAEYMI